MRSETLLMAALALSALCAVAWGGDSPHEILTPEEEAEREMLRKRNAEPALACVPDELRATVTQGRTVAVPIKISNVGGQSLRWAITLAPEWLRVNPRNGELGFGEERTLPVTFDATGLVQGPVKGTVVVEAEGAKGSPMTLRVDGTVLPAVDGMAQDDSPRKRVVEPAGPWTVRLSSARVDAHLTARGAWLLDGGPDTPFQLPASGIGISASYEARMRSVFREFEVGWSQARVASTDGPGGVSYDDEFSYTFIGVRAAFGMGQPVRSSISVGYALLDFERRATWAGSNVEADGRGPYFGVGVTYMLNRKVSLQAEWRWTFSDGEWLKHGPPSGQGVTEDRPTHLDFAIAVHFR